MNYGINHLLKIYLTVATLYMYMYIPRDARGKRRYASSIKLRIRKRATLKQPAVITSYEPKYIEHLKLTDNQEI